MAAGPYRDLPPPAFWPQTVAAGDAAFDWLPAPRFALTPATRLLTMGSCFARHLHAGLVARGWSVIDAEPAPPGLPAAVARRYGHGLFSTRSGNVYCARQAAQLLAEAGGQHQPADPVWAKGARFVDALRPGVEPEGLETPAAVIAARQHHLAALRDALARAEVLVLTLGLAEIWSDRASGTLFPSAPGVLAGSFDPARHSLVVQDHAAVLADLRAVAGLARRHQPGMRLLLSLSPVPLAATATGQPVWLATARAKAVLRAAIDSFVAEDAGADYFPAYEIVTAPFARTPMLRRGLRQPSSAGVAAVLRAFLALHGHAGGPVPAPPDGDSNDAVADDDDDAHCEEALNAATARGAE